jgi:hypothetical protein
MKLSTIDMYLDAYFAEGVTVSLVGAPGRGKTSLAHAYAKRKALQTGKPFGVVVCFVSSMTAPDVMGYLFKKEVKRPDGTTMSMTDPCVPQWCLTVDGKTVWDYDQGLVILEEFGQGQLDVKAALAPLLLEKRIEPWSLPAGWNVITTANRTKDRSAVTKSLDLVINRVAEIEIDDDLEGWLKWADDNNVHWLFRAFAERYPQVVFTESAPEKQGPWCTPRSFTRAANVFSSMEKLNLDTHDSAQEGIAALIGDGAAVQLFAFSKMRLALPTFEEIVADPAGAKCPGADQPDACMVAAYMLAERTTANNAAAVIKYIDRLPADFGVTYAARAIAKNKALLLNRAFQEYAKLNQGVFNIISPQHS